MNNALALGKPHSICLMQCPLCCLAASLHRRNARLSASEKSSMDVIDTSRQN